LDSKYLFMENFTELYAKHMEKKDILIWKNKPNEPVWKMRNWCKMSVLEKFGLRERVFNEDLVDSWAGAIFLRKTEFSTNFINEWLQLCCVYEDITDARSNIANSSEFREHRHDQSLLSVLVYKYSIGLEYFEKKILQNIRTSY